MNYTKATGSTLAAHLRAGVAPGTPYQDQDTTGHVTLMLETLTVRIAVEGTPHELAETLLNIVDELHAHDLPRVA